MWRYSVILVLLLCSCSKKNVQDEPSISVVDSIVFRNYIDYCGLRNGVEYFVTTKKSLTDDTLYVDTGEHHIKVAIDTINSNLNYKKYCLQSGYEGISRLADQAEYYKTVTNFKKGTLRTVDDAFIDSLAITNATKTIYYLDGEKVSPTDSIKMNATNAPLKIITRHSQQP